ncbi:MAG: hypothetical protein ACKVQA_16260 [Burkholderiales bacterium]
MDSVLDWRSTTAFSPQTARSASTAATFQQLDVFARDERRPAAFSVPRDIPRRVAVRLQIEDRSIELTFHLGNNLPGWINPVLSSLSERWGVKPGWDTYDARPTEIEHVDRLLNCLYALMNDASTPPIITPLADGGVQAEWHRNGNELELVVPADGPARYYYYNAKTKAERKDILKESRHALVRRLIAEF